MYFFSTCTLNDSSSFLSAVAKTSFLTSDRLLFELTIHFLSSSDKLSKALISLDLLVTVLLLTSNALYKSVAFI